MTTWMKTDCLVGLVSDTTIQESISNADWLYGALILRIFDTCLNLVSINYYTGRCI